MGSTGKDAHIGSTSTPTRSATRLREPQPSHFERTFLMRKMLLMAIAGYLWKKYKGHKPADRNSANAAPVRTATADHS